METVEFYNDVYKYAWNLAVLSADHLETGFLSLTPKNAIDKEQAQELIATSNMLLQSMARQILETEKDMARYINSLSFGMMYQYCFDKGMELMYHYIQGSETIPTTFCVSDSIENEGPDIPSQYQPGADIISKMASILRELKNYCHSTYPEMIGTVNYLFCFFRVAMNLGFLYCLEMKME